MQPLPFSQLNGQEVQHSSPSARVKAGAVYTSGFVQQQGEFFRWGWNQLAIHKDSITQWIALITRASRAAIE